MSGKERNDEEYQWNEVDKLKSNSDQMQYDQTNNNKLNLEHIIYSVPFSKLKLEEYDSLFEGNSNTPLPSLNQEFREIKSTTSAKNPFEIKKCCSDGRFSCGEELTNENYQKGFQCCSCYLKDQSFVNANSGSSKSIAMAESLPNSFNNDEKIKTQILNANYVSSPLYGIRSIRIT